LIVIPVGGVGDRFQYSIEEERRNRRSRFSPELLDALEILPKPLLPVGEAPLIDLILGVFQNQGYTDFLLLTGHQGAEIKKHFKTRDPKGVNISFLDTKGKTVVTTLIENSHLMGDRFIHSFGDTLTDSDLEILRNSHTTQGNEASFCTTRTGFHSFTGVALIETAALHPKGALSNFQLPDGISSYLRERGTMVEAADWLYNVNRLETWDMLARAFKPGSELWDAVNLGWPQYKEQQSQRTAKMFLSPDDVQRGLNPPTKQRCKT